MKNLLPKFKSFSLEDYASISTFNLEQTFSQDIRPTLLKLYSQDELLQLDPPETNHKLAKRKPRPRNKVLSVSSETQLIEISPLSVEERGLADRPVLVLPDAPIPAPVPFYYDINRQRVDNFRITIDNELTLDTDLILQRAGSIHTNIITSRTRYTRSFASLVNYFSSDIGVCM